MKLDKNGYAPSVIEDDGYCYLCGKGGDLARHEIYHGPNREKAKAVGAWVTLCPACHWKVHHPKKNDVNWDLYLKHNCYGRVCEANGWTDEDFRREFGKSYVSL